MLTENMLLTAMKTAYDQYFGRLYHRLTMWLIYGYTDETHNNIMNSYAQHNPK